MIKQGTGKWYIIGLIAVLILIQLIRPSRTNPPVIPSQSLEAHVEVPAEVLTIMKRACYDCHSSSTAWPWYSNVAPVSWYVAHDVNTARGHVNLQNWEAQINPDEGKEHLGLICKLVRNGEMPPADYRVMHKDANLSITDVNTVCAWSLKFADKDAPDKKSD
jgi:hypothetical protein